MRNEHLPLLTRISTISKYLLPLLYLTFAAYLVTMIGVSVLLYSSPTSAGADVISTPYIYTTMIQINSGELTSDDKQLVFVAVLGYSIFLLPGIWCAIQLVHQFNRKQIFSDAAVLYSRRIAWLYLVFFLISKLTLTVGAWTPQGFAFSLNPYTFTRDFIFLGLVWLFAWMLELGAALHLDSELAI